MDSIQQLNLNNNYYTDQNLLFDSSFLNLDSFFNKVYLFFKQFFNPDNTLNNGSEIYINWILLSGILQTVLYILLIFFIVVIAYTIVRLIEIRTKEHKYLQSKILEYAEKQKTLKEKSEEKKENDHPKNKRWANILTHVFSPNPSDWKFAIIDADEMLFTLLDQLGFKGEGLGDKLKSADRDKFHSLSAAWEVHTIRNRIAHEGTAYELSQREAKRVIALYEQIFYEFGYI